MNEKDKDIDDAGFYVAPRPEPIALIDLDGTLCDFEGRMIEELERIASPGEPPIPLKHEGEPSYITARRRLIKKQPGFWLNLKPIPLGMFVLRELQRLEFDVHVLTNGPRFNAGAWQEKVEWGLQHIPEVPVTITRDKGLMYGKVLVDDWPDYVARWLTWRPRGLVIMPATSMNEGFKHPNVLRVGYENRELITPRLEQVRNTIGD